MHGSTYWKHWPAFFWSDSQWYKYKLLLFALTIEGAYFHPFNDRKYLKNRHSSFGEVKDRYISYEFENMFCSLSQSIGHGAYLKRLFVKIL